MDEDFQSNYSANNWDDPECEHSSIDDSGYCLGCGMFMSSYCNDQQYEASRPNKEIGGNSVVERINNFDTSTEVKVRAIHIMRQIIFLSLFH